MKSAVRLSLCDQADNLQEPSLGNLNKPTMVEIPPSFMVSICASVHICSLSIALPGWCLSQAIYLGKSEWRPIEA